MVANRHALLDLTDSLIIGEAQVQYAVYGKLEGKRRRKLTGVKVASCTGTLWVHVVFWRLHSHGTERILHKGALVDATGNATVEPLEIPKQHTGWRDGLRRFRAEIRLSEAEDPEAAPLDVRQYGPGEIHVRK
jgi:hypothetical protein